MKLIFQLELKDKDSIIQLDKHKNELKYIINLYHLYLYMIFTTKIYFGMSIFILIYSILKEREEYGCSGFSIKKQCDELKSIYFNNTYPLPTDNKKTLIIKLKKLLSFHSNCAVWRKCFIIATVIIFIIRCINTEIKYESLISLHLTIIGILYFYHNYLDFHIYRVADDIGSKILEML